MKHTPAPWKVSNAIDGTGHAMATVIEDVKGPFREICRSYDLEPNDLTETIANARLIAAAPEMLQALELAIRFLDHPETKAIPFAFPVDGVITQVRAAIAKAKGES